MSVTDQTVGEMSDSLTGFDEIAIKNAMGATVTDLMQHDSVMAIRGLVMIHHKRDAGCKDTVAREFALSMRMDAALAFFADDDGDDGDAGLPGGAVSAAGEGEPASS